MIGKRLQGVSFARTLVNLVLATVLFWAVYLAVFSSDAIQPAAGTSYWPFLLVSLAVLAICGLRRSRSRPRLALLSNGVRQEISQALRESAAVTLGLLFYLVITKDVAISRTFLLVFLGLLTVTLAVSAVLLPKLITSMFFGRHRRCRTVLVGDVGNSEALIDWVRSKAIFGLEFVGVISDDIAPGFHHLGSRADLAEILPRSGAHVVLADSTSHREELRSMKQICDRHGVRLIFPCSLATGVQEPVSFIEDGGLQFLSFRSEPLECPINRLLKRTLDFAMAGAVLVCVLPPLCLLVWLAQRFQSPGPLFHRQMRVGRQNRLFRIFKFRTMHVGDFDETVQATSEDPRVFPLGRLLRRLSLDEIPQFLNVLLGDMSIVGPRPHLAAHEDRFATVSHAYRVRNLIKPGITGLAQVRGYRGETRVDADIVNRTDSDLFYLENWSLTMDLTIIGKTALQIFRAPASAY